MEDTYRHKGLRKRLVDVVKSKGITDERILAAVNKVARHLFIPDSVFSKTAYEDKAFPIGEGQTISQPFTVAYQTMLLDVKPGDHVLEIGTGSGYQACILAELGAKVFSIERHQKLYHRTRSLLVDLGYTSIRTYFGDGFEGLPPYAPFDKILITAAAPFIPEQLKKQLKVGGILVVPVENNNGQDMIRLVKTGDNEFEQEVFDRFAFVPMLKGKVY